MRQRMMKDHVLLTVNGCSLQRSACGVDTSSVSCYGIFAWWEDIFNASWERGSLEDLILCCRLDPTSFILSLLVDQVLNKTGMYYFMAHSMHGLSLWRWCLPNLSDQIVCFSPLFCYQSQEQINMWTNLVNLASQKWLCKFVEDIKMVSAVDKCLRGGWVFSLNNLFQNYRDSRE